MKYNVYVDQKNRMVSLFRCINDKKHKCMWVDEDARDLWQTGEEYEIPEHGENQKLFKEFNGIMTIKLRRATPEEIIMVKLSEGGQK